MDDYVKVFVKIIGDDDAHSMAVSREDSKVLIQKFDEQLSLVITGKIIECSGFPKNDIITNKDVTVLLKKDSLSYIEITEIGIEGEEC